MNKSYYLLLSLSTFFILLILFFLSADAGYFTRLVVISGTLIIAVISLLSYLFAQRSVADQNPYKFVRAVMGATFLKFFLSILAVGALLFAYNKHLHKPDLYVLMFVYIIYAVIEASFLSKASRIKK